MDPICHRRATGPQTHPENLPPLNPSMPTAASDPFHHWELYFPIVGYFTDQQPHQPAASCAIQL